MPVCCGRCTKPASRSTWSAAAASALRRRCLPPSTAAPGSGKRPAYGRTDPPPVFYGWRPPLRFAGYAVLLAGLILLLPMALLAGAVLVGLVGMLLTLLGLETAGATLTTWFTGWVAALFAPLALPTIVPRLVLFALLAAVAILIGAQLAVVFARSAAAPVAGAACRGGCSVRRCPRNDWSRVAATELWNLIRGAAPLAAPARDRAGAQVRRAADRQPWPAGLPRTADHRARHGRPARRRVCAARADSARTFFLPRCLRTQHARYRGIRSVGRRAEHALDALEGALAVPLATEPHLARFSSEGPWRGEAHRLCDRPEGLSRLIEEAAAAGAEQVILVSASPTAGAGPRAQCRTIGPSRPSRRAARCLRDRVAA